MADREPARVTNLDRYGNPRCPGAGRVTSPPPARRNRAGILPRNLATGKPSHAAGIGALWLDGDV